MGSRRQRGDKGALSTAGTRDGPTPDRLCFSTDITLSKVGMRSRRAREAEQGLLWPALCGPCAWLGSRRLPSWQGRVCASCLAYDRATILSASTQSPWTPTRCCSAQKSRSMGASYHHHSTSRLPADTPTDCALLSDQAGRGSELRRAAVPNAPSPAALPPVRCSRGAQEFTIAGLSVGCAVQWDLRAEFGVEFRTAGLTVACSAVGPGGRGARHPNAGLGRVGCGGGGDAGGGYAVPNDGPRVWTKGAPG